MSVTGVKSIFRSENVSLSSENTGLNLVPRKPKGSSQRFGLGG